MIFGAFPRIGKLTGALLGAVAGAEVHAELVGLQLERLDLPVEHEHLAGQRLDALFGLFLEAGVLVEVEDVGEHLLALASRLAGELVGAALEQEGPS